LSNQSYDAVVIGSGPNGLAAAITLARAGKSVLVLEAADTFGGGMRSAEVTLPGFTHDICSTAHPMAQVSSFFRSLPLSEYGLEWSYSPAPVAHPLDDGCAAILERSVDETALKLGPDGEAYRRLFGPLVANAEPLFADALAPLGFPRHPIILARFGLRALRSAQGLATSWFKTAKARALFAGLAAHSLLPLDKTLSAAVALVLGAAGHVAGWPVARGGSQKIADALVSYFRSLGGEARTGERVDSFDQLPSARVVLFDTSPGPMSRICGERMSPSYRKRLARFRHGPGVFKLDWALSGPIPWKAEECKRAATVHVGGTLEEVALSERMAWYGDHCEKPWVLRVQPTICDPTRAPNGMHIGWGYCHVPNGSTVDMTARIENQIERFAPGFRDLILAKKAMAPADFQQHNANYIGGDIGGGAMDLWQAFTRPVARIVPYSTPTRGIYLCSASTPPGPGVHGLCGFFAAQAALKELR
jgi:phytoene dehydrogenase-like protein